MVDLPSGFERDNVTIENENRELGRPEVNVEDEQEAKKQMHSDFLRRKLCGKQQGKAPRKNQRRRLTYAETTESMVKELSE